MSLLVRTCGWNKELASPGKLIIISDDLHLKKNSIGFIGSLVVTNLILNKILQLGGLIDNDSIYLKIDKYSE